MNKEDVVIVVRALICCTNLKRKYNVEEVVDDLFKEKEIMESRERVEKGLDQTIANMRARAKMGPRFECSRILGDGDINIRAEYDLLSDEMKLQIFNNKGKR